MIKLKKRKTKVVRVSKLVSRIQDIRTHGEEPVQDQDHEITREHLAYSLNWYNYMCTKSEILGFLIDYVEKNNLPYKKDILKLKEWQIPNTLGVLVKIEDNGAILTQHNEDYIVNEFNKIVEKSSKIKTKVINNTKSIQKRVTDKAGECIADIEDRFDKQDWNFSLYQYLTDKKVPGMYGTKIKDYYERIFDELNMALKTKDPEIKKAYKNSDLKNAVKWLGKLIEDAKRFSNNAKQTRKPRKKKIIKSETLIKKLQFLKEDVSLKIVSVDPIKLIGSQEVWLFNTKNKQITCLKTNSHKGFSVKGTTLLNIDDDTSWVKRSGRKDEFVISTILKGTKPQRKNLAKKINSKSLIPTGRINKYMVILRIEK